MDIVIVIVVGLIGFGLGGLFMNEVCWRSGRKELDRLQRESERLRADDAAMFVELHAKYDAFSAKWDANAEARVAEIERIRTDALGWCREVIAASQGTS